MLLCVYSLVAQTVKNLPASVGDAEDLGSISGSGRSLGGRNGNILVFLAWKIPQTEEPSGYSPRGCEESDTTEHLSTLSYAQNPIGD